jgi:hypothetical protein
MWKYLFAKNRWGLQAGAGLMSFGAGVSCHLKPRISSPFVSLQYWHMVSGKSDKEDADILGVMYVYRYKKWLQAGVGLGTFLSESGEQKAGEALPMVQVGIFVPFSPTLSFKPQPSTASPAAQSPEEKREPSRPRQAVYFEAFGRALLYSVSYDRRVFAGSGGLGASVGLSYFYALGGAARLMPLSVYYLTGRGNHHMELGIGATSSFYRLNVVGTATIGYRYQPASGLMLRAGVIPMLMSYGIRELPAVTGGVSAGYAF